jgi:hypothetical protein
MGYDLKFRGSVGFDSTVDLVVSLPLTMQLLDQIGGIKTPLGLLTDQLPKMRVDVPLVGTREHPRLDFAKVDKQAIMKQLLSLPAAPAKGVEGLLKELPGMGGGGKKQ